MMKDSEKHIDQLLDSYRPPASRNKEEAWQLLESRMEDAQSTMKKGSVLLYWVSGAVAAMLVVLLGLFQSGIFSSIEQNSLIANQTVWLPDSSMVLLNANSKIVYNYQLIGGKRQIELEGEAYFKVEKGKPFHIKFPGGKLQVLGTEFNLSAYSEDFILVDCVSGKVEIETAAGKVTLIKNQGMSLIGGKFRGPFTVSEADVKNRMGGYYNWGNTNLSEIFSYIGYRFGYNINISNHVKDRSFGGTLPFKNLQQTIDILSVAMQLDIEVDEVKKQIIIRPD